MNLTVAEEGKEYITVHDAYITTEDVRKAVASVVKGENRIKIVMYNK